MLVVAMSLAPFQSRSLVALKFLAFFFALLLGNPVDAQNAKQECEATIKSLQLPMVPYLFEKGGLFPFDQHRFGAATCLVRPNGTVVRVEMPNGVVAEDNFIGREALALRAAATEAADRLIAEARTKRDAAKQVADSMFQSERSQIQKQLEDFLVSVRQGTPNQTLASALGISQQQKGISTSSLATSVRPEPKKLDIQDIADKLNNNRTHIQREEFWNFAKGRTLTVAGKVEEVVSSGFLRDPYVSISALNYNIRVTCLFRSDQESRILSLSKGQVIACEGALQSYLFLFDLPSILISGSQFK